MRPACIAACVLAATLVPVPATAKPARSLIADAHGDSAAFDGLDIVCGNVAVGRKEVVAVLTLAGRPTTPLGGEWQLGMTVSGVRVTFALRETGGGYSASVQAGGTTVQSHFVVDGSTIRWTVPRRGVPALARPAVKVSGAAATTATFGVTADSAATPGVCS